MSDLVSRDDIEEKVGRTRHETDHYGRLVLDDDTGEYPVPSGKFYVLHSQECIDSGKDLRECEYSLAMDRGITPGNHWMKLVGQPMVLSISEGLLSTCNKCE